MMDPRALANLVLDMPEERGAKVTNLSLNKIAYFLHGAFLAHFSKPLVDAKIEAWQFGPVFREIYHQFKSNDDKPISGRAKKLNPVTGEYENCEYELEQNEYEFLAQMAEPYLNMSAAHLVELSHVRGGLGITPGFMMGS